MQYNRILLAIAFIGITSPATQADDVFRKQIIRLLPQADADGDGTISDSEEAAMTRQALKRFPQLDKDGDGSLSDSEKKGLLRAAAKRAGRNKRGSTATQRGTSSKQMEYAEFLNNLGLNAERGIEYKKNTAQQANKLEFIYPKNKVYERAPLFIYIHGGGNTGGSRTVVYNKGNLIIEELTKAGIAVASIDYRVFGQGEELGFHHLFQDCKDALRFLAKNSDRFGIDPHRMVTWGTSAGGSKALVCALTESDFLPGEVAGPDTDHTVLGAISFFGVTTFMVPELFQKRLERFPSRSQSKGEMLFKPTDGLSTEEIKKLVSADQHLKANSPPILLVHGDSDPVVPGELSEHLYQEGKAKGADVKYVEVKNAGHGFKPAKGGQASMTWDETQKLIISQVLEWVK